MNYKQVLQMIRSIKFPDMFSNASTNMVDGHEATAQNLINTLYASKSSHFGDPYFGSNIKRRIFEQNDIILRDLIIDDIYTAISTFMPQIRVERKDIEIVQDRATIHANLKVKNLIDFNVEEFSIALFNLEELN